MAEDVVVRDLTPEMMDAGRRLIEHLDATSWKPQGALWLFLPEAGQWRLLIADNDLGATGPRIAYSQIQNELKQLAVPDSVLSLSDIMVVPSNHPVLGLLRTAVRTGPGLGGVRFSRNVINGQYIEDAYIYRLM